MFSGAVRFIKSKIYFVDIFAKRFKNSALAKIF